MKKLLSCALLMLAVHAAPGQPSVAGVCDPGECQPEVAAPSGSASETPESQLATECGTLRQTLAEKHASPEERIRAMDEWIGRHKAQMDQVAQARRTASALQAVRATAGTSAVVVESDPLKARIAQIDGEVAGAVAEMRGRKLPPEEQIALVDEFLAANKRAFAERGELQAQLGARETAAAPAPTTSSTASPASQTPQQARMEQISGEMRQIMKNARGLSPEESIAAIDAAAPQIQQREREMKQLQVERQTDIQQAEPVSQQPVTSNQ